MLCEKCAPRELEAMRALESLTPSGSEFVNDVKRCVEFVRSTQTSQMQMLVQFKKERDALQKVINALPLDAFGDDMAECDAADFVDHSGEFFKAMQLAKALKTT